MTTGNPARRWWDIKSDRRWFPIGTDRDSKAPAVGYASDKPDGGHTARGAPVYPWLTADAVQTAMAGLNFGPMDGLIGFDLDYKPKLAMDRAVKKRAWQRMGEIKAGLLALGLKPELSHSGVGRHFFAMADAELLAELKRRGARVKVVIVPGPDARKDTAAVELFGGGNAYIAVTWNWEDGEPDVLPVVTLDQVLRVVPELVPAGGGQASGQQSFGQWPPPGASFREDDVEYAERLLLSTDPPADHDLWVKVMGAAKNSGLPMEVVDAWSRRGDKYQEGEVDRRWASLGGKGVGIGTLVDFAKSQGVNVRRQGNARWRDAGRSSAPGDAAGNASESRQEASGSPPGDAQGKSDRESEPAAYMGEYACFRALVNRYGHRMRYLVDSEASGTVLVSDDDGRWMGFSNTRHSPSRSLVMKWLGSMVNDGEIKDSDRAGVIGRIMDGGYDLDRVSWRELNAFERHPCVPTAGGAVDLLSSGMLTPEQTRELMFRQVWSAPLPDMSLLARGHANVDRLLMPVFAPALDLFAYSLAVRGKSIAQVKLRRKNRGKSTLLTLLSAAFGDAVFVRKQTKRLPDGEGFSDILSPLGDCLVLIFDEMNQIRGAGNTAADRLVSDIVELHFKYQTPYQVLRLGSSFMVGNDWPGWELTEDGMTGEPGDWGRVDELCLLLDDAETAPKLERSDRTLLTSDPTAAQYLQAWVIARARLYAASPDTPFEDMCLPSTLGALSAGRAEVAALVAQADAEQSREAMAARVKVLMEQVEYTGSVGDALSVVAVKEALGVKQTAAMPPEVQAAMVAVQGKIPERRQVTQPDGSRIYSYLGWRWKVGAEPETPELCSEAGCERPAVDGGMCELCASASDFPGGE